MSLLTRVLVALLAVLTVAAPSAVATADGERWSWPVSPAPEVVRGFEPPASTYAAGHRGADLLGTPGTAVRAVAPGKVLFAGSVAGVGVVTVAHRGSTSTFQPVDAAVGTGDRVDRTQVLGTLAANGSHCRPRACLHLGRTVAGAYADPLELLASPAHVRLFRPFGAPPLPPTPATGSGQLLRPVAGPVTSTYGMRVHPITGVYKLHDGLDLGAPCGTPVRAAADGVVMSTHDDPAYGNRVIVRHGPASGEGGPVTTTYNHLSTFGVSAGDRLRRGQVLGAVGATGYATGCHLHFMVTVVGETVDPAAWL